MVNLKKLLEKILVQLKIVSDGDQIPKYALRTYTTGTNLTDYRVWHSMSSFNITANHFETNDSNYFASATDGITVKKTGRYFLMITGHAVCKSQTGAYTRIAIRVLKNNTSNQIGYNKFFYDGMGRNTIEYEWSYSFTASANDLIYMQMYKYDTNNTAVTYRPGYVTMEIFYLGPE